MEDRGLKITQSKTRRMVVDMVDAISRVRTV